MQASRAKGERTTIEGRWTIRLPARADVKRRTKSWNDEVGDLHGRPERLVRYCGNCFSAPRESPFFFFGPRRGTIHTMPAHFRPEVLSLPSTTHAHFPFPSSPVPLRRRSSPCLPLPRHLLRARIASSVHNGQPVVRARATHREDRPIDRFSHENFFSRSRNGHVDGRSRRSLA